MKQPVRHLLQRGQQRRLDARLRRMNQEMLGRGGIQKWERVDTDALTIPDESNGEDESSAMAASETMSQQLGGQSSLDLQRTASLGHHLAAKTSLSVGGGKQPEGYDHQQHIRCLSATASSIQGHH